MLRAWFSAPGYLYLVLWVSLSSAVVGLSPARSTNSAVFSGNVHSKRLLLASAETPAVSGVEARVVVRGAIGKDDMSSIVADIKAQMTNVDFRSESMRQFLASHGVSEKQQLSAPLISAAVKPLPPITTTTSVQLITTEAATAQPKIPMYPAYLNPFAGSTLPPSLALTSTSPAAMTVSSTDAWMEPHHKAYSIDKPVKASYKDGDNGQRMECFDGMCKTIINGNVVFVPDN